MWLNLTLNLAILCIDKVSTYRILWFYGFVVTIHFAGLAHTKFSGKNPKLLKSLNLVPAKFRYFKVYHPAVSSQAWLSVVFALLHTLC